MFSLTVHYFLARVQSPTCTTYEKFLLKSILTLKSGSVLCDCKYKAASYISPTICFFLIYSKLWEALLYPITLTVFSFQEHPNSRFQEHIHMNIWISWEWKELFRWNKNHFSQFVKSYPGVEIRGNFLNRHKFTNLLKSVSPCMTMVHDKGNFWLFSLLGRQKMTFHTYKES